MSSRTLLGGKVPSSVLKAAKDVKNGKVSRREFLATATALGVTGAAAMSMIGVKPAAAGSHGKMGGELRISMQVKQMTDPRLFDWSEMGNTARHFCEPLVRWNRGFTFSPRLLAGWEANEDATVYTLKLRDNVTWNNGDKCTAEHIAWNLQRWTEGDVEGNSMAARVSSLTKEGVEIVDATTIRLNLTKPDITIIAGMADYPGLIVHPDFGGDLSANPIGTGPYNMVEFEVEVGARYEKRDPAEWYGTAEWGEVKLDSIVYTDYGNDPAPETAAFESGEIDANYETFPAQAELMDGLGFTRSQVATGATIIARGHQSEGSIMANKNFRKALALCVSNADMLEVGQNGIGSVAENHHVGPMHEEYVDLGEKPTQNIEAAKALLESEGLAGAEFTYSYLAGGDYRQSTSEAMISQFREAGLNVEADGRPASDFWSNWLNYPYSTTNWNGRPLGVQIYGLAYRGGVKWNEANYSNAEFDALLDEANSLADPAARSVVMGKLEKILQDDGVIIQPYWRGILCHHSDAVHGYFKHQANEHHLEEVSMG